MKTYSSEPIVAMDHAMKKVKTAYDTAYLQES